MKVEINYVLRGKFVAKIVQLRSLDRVLANAEEQGALAVVVYPPYLSRKSVPTNFIYRA